MSRAGASGPSVAIAAFLAAIALAWGCSSGGGDTPSFSATVTASGTTPAPRLVKLVPKSTSGALFVVQAVFYGPDTSLDLYSFAFDVHIGDPNIARFVPSSAVAGDALQASTGQGISVQADLASSGGTVDNARVVVGVTKTGGGSGNGVAGASAVVVELTFAVQAAGTTTLTLTGSPAPEALDSGGVPIGSITFDAAPATATGS